MSLTEPGQGTAATTGAAGAALEASVAEIDHQDLWQRTAIAVAAVSGEQYHARKVLHEVSKLVDRWAEVELIDSELTLHYPED